MVDRVRPEPGWAASPASSNLAPALFRRSPTVRTHDFGSWGAGSIPAAGVIGV